MTFVRCEPMEVATCHHDMLQLVSMLQSKIHQQAKCQQDKRMHSGSALSACVQLASVLHSALVAMHGASGSPQQHELEQKAAQRLQRACQIAMRVLPEEELTPQLTQALQGDTQAIASIAQQYETAQVHALEQELAALRETLQQQQQPAAGMSAANQDSLVACVRALRGLERSVAAQAELHADMEMTFDSSDYSLENMAYGSTPWTSFMAVMSDAAVQAALTAAGMHLGSGKRFMAWGASSGWLLFYAHLTFGWRCCGVELLGSQVARARQVQEELLPGSQGVIEFEHGDLLHSSLADVGALMLTDQCWDAGLRVAAASKAATELASGAVVVSYLPLNHERLLLTATVTAPVSWNAQQRFHVYQVA